MTAPPFAGPERVLVVLRQAVDALEIQPRAGGIAWNRSQAYRRIKAKRALRMLINELAGEPAKEGQR